LIVKFFPMIYIPIFKTLFPICNPNLILNLLLPALYNQDDLIELRTGKGIHRLIPGITGWAQVNGRDELPIPVKVEFDAYYLKNRSFAFDFKILWMTFVKVVRRDGVSH